MKILYIVFVYLVLAELIAALVNSRRTYSDEFHPNGCNATPEANWGECCYQHDFHYQTGGGPIDRLRADFALTRCILGNKNPFAAVLYLIGVRFGGMWAFHFGRKKELQ